LFKLTKDFFSKTNPHLVLLDSHNFHVTLKVMHKAKNVGLNLITLQFHTSHALQAFDVAWLKPFKLPWGL
jgi:hypothetical protein